MREPIKIKTDWSDVQKDYEQYFLKQKLRDKSPKNQSQVYSQIQDNS